MGLTVTLLLGIFIIMQSVVSITSQGQLTIPSYIREMFGIVNGAKALIKVVEGKLIVEPRVDFWALQGSLKSKVKLSDEQLRQARRDFSKKWAKND